MSFIRTVSPTANIAGASASRSVGPPRRIAGVTSVGAIGVTPGLGGDSTLPASISSRVTSPRSIISVSRPASQIWK